MSNERDFMSVALIALLWSVIVRVVLPLEQDKEFWCGAVGAGAKQSSTEIARYNSWPIRHRQGPPTTFFCSRLGCRAALWPERLAQLKH